MTNAICLNLPKPPSINRTRKIDWAQHQVFRDWRDQVDKFYLVQKRSLAPPILGRYEARIILDEQQCSLDADNAAKHVIDVARRYRLVADDSPKYLRRVVSEYGSAPEGCRMILTPMD